MKSLSFLGPESTHLNDFYILESLFEEISVYNTYSNIIIVINILEVVAS